MNDQYNDDISTIYIYKMFLAKEKALYQTLNMMKMQNTVFIGYFWAPAEEERGIIDKLSNKFPTVRMVRYENHTISRPTYIKTNEVTEIFQLIVDTYGVPQYQEANPATITIATFPFFFGVMFGDMGHGSVLLAFALYLVFNAEKLRQSKAGKGIIKVRYLLLLMGIMATYAGFIYNEFFAIKPNIFGSCYQMNNPIQMNQSIPLEPATITQKFFYRRAHKECVYPFGLDPIWSFSENELTLVNNIKMKLSVIFGVFHMSIGIVMKGTNMWYRKMWLELVTEVVGGFFILFFLFGWMDVLIISKWFATPDI